MARTQAVGVTTNIAFLAAVAAHPAYAAGELDTGFIGRHRAALLPAEEAASDKILALATLAVLQWRRAEAEAQARRSSDPYSPWHLTTGWRLNVETHRRLVFLDRGEERAVTVHYRADRYLLDLPGGRPVSRQVEARGAFDGSGDLVAELDGRATVATVVRQGAGLVVLTGARGHELQLFDPLSRGAAMEAGGGRLTAPMPGRIVAIVVAPGAKVARGTPLLVLEAMKMEHTIVAPGDGQVTEIHFAAGDLVEEGVELLALKLEEAEQEEGAVP